MPAPLLKTKLYVPAARPALVARPRLVERLRRGLQLKLTLVSAPAGYGKTTLLSEWATGAACPLAWLSLDENDNDPARFLVYLIAALQQIDPRIGRDLDLASAAPAHTLLTHLINDLAGLDRRALLVLDDYHVISAPAVHDALSFLLTHQPPTLHLAIGARRDPPLPLSQLRARGEMVDLRQNDLAFTRPEVADFLQQVLARPPAPAELDALIARSEGWIVGLQLLALSLRDAPAAGGRYVCDYIQTELLQRQPEHLRLFMQQTAVLDRLSAPLCDAVAERADSAALLRQIEEANLLLAPLDPGRSWLRYHPLLADCLRQGLDSAAQATLHGRAARWFEGQRLYDDAIRHARAAGDPADLERLVLRAAEEALPQGKLPAVESWLAVLPAERLRASGELATVKGWLAAMSGDLALADTWAGVADELLRRNGTERGRLLVLRAFLLLLDRQDLKNTIQTARNALRMLPDRPAHWRVIALWLTAEAQERSTHITKAIGTLRKAARIGQAAGELFFTGTVETFLAAALNSHGQRRKALEVCEAALQRAAGPAAGMLHTWLGALHYEANSLELADQHLSQGLALSEQSALSGYLLFSQGHLAPTLAATGRTEAALQALRRAEQLAARTRFVDPDWLLAVEAGIRLRQGDRAFAQHWASGAGLTPDVSPAYLQLGPHLTYARLLLAEGQRAEATKLLGRLASFAEKQGLYRYLLTVRLLQALAASQAGEQNTQRDALAQALKLAAPEEYYRALLDEGAALIALLPAARSHAPLFVDQLLGFAGLPAARPGAPQGLVEPLSERELEVLALIARGLRNREIADRLHIATSTVKRHINNIYGKLDAHSRTEAILKARELQLLNGPH